MGGVDSVESRWRIPLSGFRLAAVFRPEMKQKNTTAFTFILSGPLVSEPEAPEERRWVWTLKTTYSYPI